MSIADKLITVAENRPKVYSKGYYNGQINVISSSEVLKGNEIGRVIKIDDINKIEHNLDVKVCSKNILPYPYYSKSYTRNGVTFTVNEDRSITANGTATETADFWLYVDYDNLLPLKDKEITFSGCPTGGSISTYGLYLSGLYSGGSNTYVDTGSGKTQLMPHDCHAFYIRISKGVTVDNLVFKPQIEFDSVATTYTPYIQDLSGVVVSRYGKNLIAQTPIRKLKANFNECYFLPKGKYTVSMNFSNATSWRFTITLYDLNGTLITDTTSNTTHLKCINNALNYSSGNGGIYQHADNITSNYLIFETDNDYYIGINFYFGDTTANTTVSNAQIELGTTVTEYEPYKTPQTATATADGTVEGIDYLYPSLTLTTDTDGTVVNVNYIKDIDKTFNKLEAQIVALGGELA